jgi:hypothetical protein
MFPARTHSRSGDFFPHSEGVPAQALLPVYSMTFDQLNFYK